MHGIWRFHGDIIHWMAMATMSMGRSLRMRRGWSMCMCMSMSMRMRVMRCIPRVVISPLLLLTIWAICVCIPMVVRMRVCIRVGCSRRRRRIMHKRMTCVSWRRLVGRSRGCTTSRDSIFTSHRRTRASSNCCTCRIGPTSRCHIGSGNHTTRRICTQIRGTRMGTRIGN